MTINPSSGHLLFLLITCLILNGCADSQPLAPAIHDEDTASEVLHNDTVPARPMIVKPDTTLGKIKQQGIVPDSIVAFARTLIGVPYLYASTDPAKGFDCSGFITYVFTHFNMTVPRSSVEFTNYGKQIAIERSKPGDLVLFTGTDSTVRIVGHMGIIESIKNDTTYFIHSTSGKAKGVVITPLGNYYKSRFVKVVRIFFDEFF